MTSVALSFVKQMHLNKRWIDRRIVELAMLIAQILEYTSDNESRS